MSVTFFCRILALALTIHSALILGAVISMYDSLPLFSIPAANAEIRADMIQLVVATVLLAFAAKPKRKKR